MNESQRAYGRRTICGRGFSASASVRARVRWFLAIGIPVATVLVIAWFMPDGAPAPHAPVPDSGFLPPTKENTLTLVQPDERPNQPFRTDDDNAPYPTDAVTLRADVNRVVDELNARFPNSTDSLELKARTLEWMGEAAEARTLWEECLQQDPGFSHALYGLANRTAIEGDHEEALELARRALEVDPGYFLARIVAAESLLQLGRPEEAVVLLRDYLKLDPRSQGAFLLGQAYSRMGKYEEALDAYRTAVQLYPGHAEAYSAMATALVRLGKREEAKEALATARQVRKEQADGRPSRKSPRKDLRLMLDNAARLYGDAARIYAANGLRPKAESLLRRAAVVSPTDASSRFGLAALLARQNRMSEALGMLEQVVAAQPDDFDTWVQLAQVYGSLSAWPRAEEALQKACQLAPERADVWSVRADYLLRRNKNLDDAVSFARKAVELVPNAANYALLAAACDRAGDLPAAVEAIDEAVKKAPESTVFQNVQREMRAELSKNQGEAAAGPGVPPEDGMSDHP